MTPELAIALEQDLDAIDALKSWVNDLPLSAPAMLDTLGRCEMLLKAHFEPAAVVEREEPFPLPAASVYATDARRPDPVPLAYAITTACQSDGEAPFCPTCDSVEDGK